MHVFMDMLACAHGYADHPTMCSKYSRDIVVSHALVIKKKLGTPYLVVISPVALNIQIQACQTSGVLLVQCLHKNLPL